MGTIKSEKPSVVKQTKTAISNIFSFGDEDENAPQREDFPMGRSGAKQFSDAQKEYNASSSFASVASPQQTFVTDTDLSSQSDATTFPQMQQRIQNAFSNNTQTNTDAPSRDELLNDLERRRTAMQNKYYPE